jgi:hypothetical protein
MTERTEDSVVVEYRPALTLRELIRCCFRRRKRDEPRYVKSTVKLSVQQNQIKLLQTAQIKSVAGCSDTILPLIQAFRKRLEAAILHNQKAPISDESRFQFDEPDEDDFVLTCKNESSSFYHIHKILSDDSSELGGRLAAFVTHFNQEFENRNESGGATEDTPMDAVKDEIEDVVDILLTQYNFGRSNSD